jgi:hypothetical protein
MTDRGEDEAGQEAMLPVFAGMCLPCRKEPVRWLYDEWDYGGGWKVGIRSEAPLPPPGLDCGPMA